MRDRLMGEVVRSLDDLAGGTGSLHERRIGRGASVIAESCKGERSRSRGGASATVGARRYGFAPVPPQVAHIVDVGTDSETWPPSIDVSAPK